MSAKVGNRLDGEELYHMDPNVGVGLEMQLGDIAQETLAELIGLRHLDDVCLAVEMESTSMIGKGLACDDGPRPFADLMLLKDMLKGCSIGV